LQLFRTPFDQGALTNFHPITIVVSRTISNLVTLRRNKLLPNQRISKVTNARLAVIHAAVWTIRYLAVPHGVYRYELTARVADLLERSSEPRT
jgi:hypothetical protein